MSRLINDMLDYTRLEMRPDRYPKQNVDLSALTTSLCDDMALIRQQGIQLTADIQPEINIYGNPQLLSRLVTNLISMHTGTEKKTAISWFVCIRMTPMHLNADRSLFLWKMTALAFPKKSRNIFSSVFIRLIHPAPEQAPVLVCPWFNRSPNFIMEQ